MTQGPFPSLSYIFFTALVTNLYMLYIFVCTGYDVSVVFLTLVKCDL